MSASTSPDPAALRVGSPGAAPAYQGGMRLLVLWLRKTPLLFSFLACCSGLGMMTLGQGWVINGVIPVPWVGALAFAFAVAAIALLLPGWARSSPRVRLEGPVLLASTPTWRQVLLLFSARVTLFIDPRTEMLIYTSRSLWLRSRTELIRFKQIAEIDYQRHTAGSIERFTVDLVLDGGRRVRLFEFQGHEEERDHEVEARGFLDLLRRAVGRFKSAGADVAGARACRSCGRKSAATRDRCVYCGGELSGET